MLYGDSWLQVDPAAVYAAAERVRAPALMTVYENDGQFDTSNVEYADGRVLRYEKGLDPIPPRCAGSTTGSRSSPATWSPSGSPANRPDLAAVHRAGRRGRAGRAPGAPTGSTRSGPRGLAEVTDLLAGRG